MTAKTMGGAKLYIGTAGTAHGSESSWTEVGEVTDFGEFGRAYALITHQPVGSRGDQKLKGGYNEGSFSFQMAEDLSDSGQDAMRTAVDSDSNYPFKVELDDDPNDGSGSAPTTYTFDALVMSFVTQFAGRDTIVGATAQMELQPNGVTKTAAQNAP